MVKFYWVQGAMVGIEPTDITSYRSLINYGGIKFYIDDNVNKNKKLMHHTNETQVTILTSLLRILVALSFCGYNDFGITYHLCSLSSVI